MTIHQKSLDWYIEKLKNNEYFSLGQYGDGEWLGIFKERLNKTNAEGTIYTSELCDALAQSLHFKADNFYFATSSVLKRADWSGIGEEKIDNYLEREALDIEFVEKEVWNDAMKEGFLMPFILQLRKMNVVIISNKALRNLNFLRYDKFIEISYPNCYQEKERVIKECKEYGKSGVYIFAAGLPAALFVQELHSIIPQSFILDVGSIFDTYVGIGAQRGFRKELYSDYMLYGEWWRKNLENLP